MLGLALSFLSKENFSHGLELEPECEFLPERRDKGVIEGERAEDDESVGKGEMEKGICVLIDENEGDL